MKTKLKTNTMKTKEEILKEALMNKVTGETSDGYHTFNELYEHRHILFLALLKTRIDAWKSWNHEDGTAPKWDGHTSNDVIERLKLLEADQQNKELSERVDELAIELHETRIKHDELFDVAEKIIKEKNAEIQRLTKEVEELKLRLSGKTFFNPFEQENTRLRELLERAGSMMSTVKHLEVLEVIDKDKYDQILSEINALNHKP